MACRVRISMLLLLGACCWPGATVGAQRGRTTAAAAPSGSRAPVTLTYLGAAGWEITDGATVILVDPYLSRVRLPMSGSSLGRAAGAGAPPVDPTFVLIPDTAAVDAHVRRADFVLLHHAHFDHILDAPYIARKTGASVIGHESSTNVLRGAGVPPAQLLTVRGGEDYVFGTTSIRVLPSIHTALLQKRYYDGRTIPSTIRPPFRLGDLAEGGSLAFLIRIGGHQILTFGSMNYVEREIEGLRPDIVLVGAADSRREIYDYTGRLMRVLASPAVVLPTHWDNYFLPSDAPQDTAVARLAAFVREVHTASPRTRVIIPKYFVPIVVPPSSK